VTLTELEPRKVPVSSGVPVTLTELARGQCHGNSAPRVRSTSPELTGTSLVRVRSTSPKLCPRHRNSARLSHDDTEFLSGLEHQPINDAGKSLEYLRLAPGGHDAETELHHIEEQPKEAQ
jgi:hypothetical protein